MTLSTVWPVCGITGRSFQHARACLNQGQVNPSILIFAFEVCGLCVVIGSPLSFNICGLFLCSWLTIPPPEGRFFDWGFWERYSELNMCARACVCAHAPARASHGGTGVYLPSESSRLWLSQPLTEILTANTCEYRRWCLRFWPWPPASLIPLDFLQYRKKILDPFRAKNGFRQHSQD